MALSSPGIGSGLDVSSIVTQLVALERKPIEALALQKTRLTTELSSYGLLQSYMANIQSAAERLTSPTFWGQTGATSSAPDAVTASVAAGALPGSYQVSVGKLALATALSSEAFAAGALFDAGTLTVSVGASAVAVEIAAGDTLETLRSKINAGQAGVSASIVRDAAGARLLITGNQTGAANAVTLTTSAGNLKALSYPPDGAPSMTRRVAAGDAELQVGGIPLTSASNVLVGVIDGVTLTLTKESAAPVALTIATSTDALRKGIQDFVAAYNEANRYLAQQTRYDDATAKAGPLQGDRAAVGLQQKMRSLAQQSSTAAPAFGHLSDLGLELQRDGSLKVNDTRLTSALAQPAALGVAFGTATSGFAQRFKALADGAVGSSGTLTSRSSGIKDSIRRNERDQQQLEDRVARTQARLTRQYSALDTNLNRLNGLSTYMNQQITNWNKTSNN